MASDVFFFTPASVRSSSVPGQTVVDVGEARQRPLEDGEDEEVGPREPGRHHAGDVLVRDDRALEDRVVARGGAHAEHVPVSLML